MKAERWRRVKALLEEILEAKEEQRESLLAERCAGDPDLRRDVEALLAADERATEFLEPNEAANVGMLTRGEEIGPYRILRLIGEGGMGEVYEAEQAKPVRRRVALKFVKLGMDTRQLIARFDAERQALALMSHPNIARVFDVGTTEKGRPYFVMEFVPGMPISAYCDDNHLGAVERLELFIQVCEGVHHAHQKGVIHRDIKPSNVLVTLVDGKPVPKIIDFGLARATAQPLTEATYVTQLGQAVGTPEFMSPEQAEGTGLDIDIRTDVYSLGVLLYELLTGARPFEFRGASLGLDELRRKIRETDPAKPSTRVRKLGETTPVVAKNRHTDPRSLVHTLRGDLDWITMKALEKDRARRYASVSELAADVERHLSHRPVLAGPTSTSYRVGKFVRRHKLGVAASGVVVLALVLGAAAAAVGLVRAQRAEARARQETETAQQEAETAKQVSEFMVELFRVSDPARARGNPVTAREILDRGAEKIRDELQDQPRVQARLMDAMGLVYRNLGLLEEAGALYRSALEVRQSVLGARDLELADTILNLGYVEVRSGRYDEAEKLMRRSVAIRTELLGDEDPRVAKGLSGLAQVFSLTERLDDARQMYERALLIYEKQTPPDESTAASILNDLAIVYEGQGDLLRAEEMFRRALEIGERVLGPDHPLVGLRLTSMGMMSMRLERPDDAERYLLRSLAILEKVLGTEHHNLAYALQALGSLYADQGRYAEAESRYRRCLEIRQASLGERHPRVVGPLEGLAELYDDQGRYGEAERFYREALALLEEVYGADSSRLSSTRDSYATFLEEQGRRREASMLRSLIESAADSP